MTTSGGYSDVGNYFAGALLTAINQSIESAGLDQPGRQFQLHGTGMVEMDPCDGLLWVRVGDAHATDGSGQQFIESRPDMHVPAFAYVIDAGIVFCREVIDDEGAAPPPEYETEIAVRDGNYRMALLSGLFDYWPDLVKPIAYSRTVSPWAPIGPDGGMSGGLVGMTVIATQLAVPNGL